MQEFIGTKRIRATPMDRQAYNDLRGWEVPADEDPTDAGYLVEYMDGGKPNLAGYLGYVSWSPKEQFEKAYRLCSAMTFGLAIEAMKMGLKVARSGWNGKGMWISLSPGTAALPAEAFWNHNNRVFAASRPEGCANVLACFTMKTAQDDILMGWLASQTDMLAEDWMVVE